MPRRERSSLLRREIAQTTPFASREEEAFLNLERTASLLHQAVASRMKPYGLTPTQYNVLRILRGAHPEALPCGEIGRRVVTPMPDVTRLVDRLEGRRLIERRRESQGDRRLVPVAILPRGLALLERLDQPILEWLEELLGPLGEKRLGALVELLELARRPLVRDPPGIDGEKTSV